MYKFAIAEQRFENFTGLVKHIKTQHYELASIYELVDNEWTQIGAVYDGVIHLKEDFEVL